MADDKSNQNLMPSNFKFVVQERHPKFPRPVFGGRKPGQRRMDRGARRRIAEWRAYQATWQKPINEIEYDAARFHNLRRNVLNLNRKQTARLLRVGINSVFNWEHGKHPTPFYAYLTLLLISESMRYRLSSEQWKDWEFVENLDYDHKPSKRKHTTRLVNRALGAHFSTEDLKGYHAAMQKLAALDAENVTLRSRVDELTRENADIRETFKVNAVSAELREMKERFETLLGKVTNG